MESKKRLQTYLDKLQQYLIVHLEEAPDQESANNAIRILRELITKG